MREGIIDIAKVLLMGLAFALIGIAFWLVFGDLLEIDTYGIMFPN